MSRLSQLRKTKKYTINGVELELRAISINEDTSDIFSITEDTAPEKSLMLMSKAVKLMLEESVPDATEEELKDAMRMDNLMPLIEAFQDINGMTNKDNKTTAQKMKDAIEARKAKPVKE